MRIWTVHPRYLDRRGLLALWREGLLAQKVLMDRTKGYRRHPQLERFRKHPDPVAAVAAYLVEVRREARRRGYFFDGRKIHRRRAKRRIIEMKGQLLYEWNCLKRKLKIRSPHVFDKCAGLDEPLAHPVFRIVAGRRWEKQTARPAAARQRGKSRG